MNERSEGRGETSSFDISRRNLLGLAGGAATALAVGHKAIAQTTATAATATSVTATKPVSNGRINQSVCQWCFNKMPVENEKPSKPVRIARAIVAPCPVAPKP